MCLVCLECFPIALQVDQGHLHIYVYTRYAVHLLGLTVPVWSFPVCLLSYAVYLCLTRSNLRLTSWAYRSANESSPVFNSSLFLYITL